jgi:2-keto-4-pentenoate hydratase
MGGPMNEQELTAVAEAFVQARRSGTWVETLPAAPASVSEAHAIQDRVAALLGESVGAFKANAPPNEEPTRGLIFERFIRSTPARFSPAEVPHLGVEAEVAFRFLRDLAPRETHYTREEVASAVAALPAIEVVSGRFREPRARTPLERVADCIINGGFVYGRDVSDWTRLDLPNLEVVLRVNGAVIVEQRGVHPTGDPLGIAVALVNMMRASTGVKAGQVVTTGSFTGMRFLKPGDRCVVEFSGLGIAEVAFD